MLLALIIFVQQYLEENLGAVKVKLTSEELLEVRVVAEKANAAQGARYPDILMPALLADTPPL